LHVSRHLPLVFLIVLLSYSLKTTSGGWGTYTYTEVTETVIVQGTSARKTYFYGDTSETDLTININMSYNHTDMVFHDFYCEDSSGKKRSVPGNANQIDLDVKYTLKKKYQQYWCKFGYIVDNAVKIESDIYSLDVSPRMKWPQNASVDKYTLKVLIPIYINYFKRISHVNVTREADSVVDEGEYRVLIWKMSGREFGTNIKIQYRYALDIREIQSITIGAAAGVLLGVLIGMLVDRFRKRLTTGKEMEQKKDNRKAARAKARH